MFIDHRFSQLPPGHGVSAALLGDLPDIAVDAVHAAKLLINSLWNKIFDIL